MANIINAATTGAIGLSTTADASGIIQFQNGGVASLTLGASGQLGVGSSINYGTAGQVLTSTGTGSAPTWATASINWQSVQTANFTAVAGSAYPINTTSAAVTVTLPASPTAGQSITLADYAGTWATNNLTINPNGLKLDGITANGTVSTNRATVSLVYVDATQGWIPYSDVSSLISQIDGLSAATAAPSAVYLQQVKGYTSNGVYWINLPTVGPTQVYCILDTACAGGGWMLAMKGTTGTTFNYSANYWTTNNTLNPSDTTRNNGDAKFNVYNYFSATDWLAIWPDIASGGDISAGYGGWTWTELNAAGSTTTLLAFMNTGSQVTKSTNPTSLNKYGSKWSMQGGFQWYGLNYQGNSSWKVRWGFATNNEGDQGSNDAGGGIGMAYYSYSAGDAQTCCTINNGIMRSARFEWYVR